MVVWETNNTGKSDIPALLRMQIQNLEGQLEKAAAAKVESDVQMYQMQEEHTEMQRRISDQLRKECAAHDASKASRRQLEQDAVASKSATAELELELRSAHESLTSAKQSHASDAALLEVRELELRNATQQVKDLTGANTKLKKTLHRSVEGLTKQLKELEGGLASRERTVEIQTSKLESVSEDRSKLVTALKALKKDRADTRTQLKVMTKALEEMEERFNSASESLKTNEHRVKLAEEERDRTLARLVDATERERQLHSKANHLDQKISKLAMEV